MLFDQGSSLVDGRKAEVEKMLQALADCIQSGSLSQAEPIASIFPITRRTPPPPHLPTRSEDVRVCFNRCASRCHTGYRCVCHAFQGGVMPEFIDRVLGRLYIDYLGLPLLSSRCDKEECTRQQAAHMTVECWLPLRIFCSKIARLQFFSRLCVLCYLGIGR